jgi:hypothetical protein
MLAGGFAIFILIAMLRALIATERPGLCAGLYAFIFMLLGFAMGGVWWAVLIGTAVLFAETFAYFWLLVRFMGQGLIFWAILFAGLVAPAVIRVAMASWGG